MSWLGGLRDRARDWLGNRPDTQMLEKDAVVQHNLDRSVFEDAMRDVPALRDMVGQLDHETGIGRELIRDVMQVFWQSDPRVREATDMQPSHLRSHAVVTDLMASPDIEGFRSMTRLDMYGSVMGTLSVAEKVRANLAKQKELEEAAKEAEEAAKKAAEAAKEVEEAEEAAEAAESPGELQGGMGPLTEEQTAALEAAQASLEGALSGAAGAQADQQAAEAKAQGLAQKLAADIDKAVREGIEAASEELNEELEMFRSWGMNTGEVQKLSFDERIKLARLLRNNRLAKFAKLIGRRRLAASAMRTKKTQFGRDEVIDTELSGDLERVLPSEFVYAMLDERFEAEFAMKLSEGQLLSRKFIGVERVEKGAIIALCDTSGSTDQKDSNGIPREVWIKATAMCLLDQAEHDGRDFVWVNFSTASEIKVWYFPKGKANIYQLIECVEHSFGGGTSWMAPIDRAIKILDGQFTNMKIRDGDIVLMTDDDCKVTPSWLETYHAAKERMTFRTFGILCGVPRRPGSHMDLLADNVREAVDFSDPNDIGDLIRVI